MVNPMPALQKLFRIGQHYYDSTAWPIIVGIGDFIGTLFRWGLTSHLAIRDIRLRYRRTMFGPFWTVLNATVFVTAIGLIFGILWQQDLQVYLPYFAIGYFLWSTIVQTMNESCAAFMSADNIIRSMRAPQGIHIQRVILRNAIVYSHQIPVMVAIMFIFSVVPAWSALWTIPLGVFLLTMLLTWLATILAVMCTRFRDIRQIVGLVLQVAFLATPIIWQVDRLQPQDGSDPSWKMQLAYTILVDCNPFYHMLHVIRGPLMGEGPPLFSLAYLAIANVIVGLIALDLHGRKKRHVAMWL